MKNKIDWMITLLPLCLILVLCFVFFVAPEQSNVVLSQIRFIFWRYIWKLLFDYRTRNFLTIYLHCLF